MDASDFVMDGLSVPPGGRREIYLKVSESFLASAVHIPVTILHGALRGPTAFVTAAVHGDEINGIEIVRKLIVETEESKLHGTLLCVPVVNIPGFLEQKRALPYNRDLNRFFPGKLRGNNADRIAYRIFKNIVLRSDWGIDLHTAAVGRSNMPHVRGDMSHPKVRRLARAFGAEVIVDNRGRLGSLRRTATERGIPTLLFEAGETGKFSRAISLAGFRGVLNVLVEMGMLEHNRLRRPRLRRRPPYQVIVKKSEWIRAERGGILDLRARPGHLVYPNELLGKILDPFGKTVTKLRSPYSGVLLGVSTQPLAIPGTGVCHIAKISKTLAKAELHLKKLKP